MPTHAIRCKTCKAPWIRHHLKVVARSRSEAEVLTWKSGGGNWNSCWPLTLWPLDLPQRHSSMSSSLRSERVCVCVFVGRCVQLLEIWADRCNCWFGGIKESVSKPSQQSNSLYPNQNHYLPNPHPDFKPELPPKQMLIPTVTLCKQSFVPFTGVNHTHIYTHYVLCSGVIISFGLVNIYSNRICTLINNDPVVFKQSLCCTLRNDFSLGKAKETFLCVWAHLFHSFQESP